MQYFKICSYKKRTHFGASEAKTAYTSQLHVLQLALLLLVQNNKQSQERYLTRSELPNFPLSVRTQPASDIVGFDTYI